ncbi:RAI1 domain-containing protein [Favolaschia claudopus]|uniref:Decapping nuclease n=1 Tax=Favolaschia claudopus TaxID=2862362 RepID=A0AAW0C256_9AGAR
MSKRNLAELLSEGDGGEDAPPTSKQRRRSPTPLLVHALPYPSLSVAPTSPPAFQQPTQIISFSYTPDRKLEFTNSALRFLAALPPRPQLSYAYERWTRRPETRPRIDGLLRALSTARAKNHPALASGFGAVGWRGVLTRIMTAPYEDRDGWDMNVMCVDGVLYFEEHLDEAKLRAKDELAPRQRLNTYYGYAFESYCTSEKPSTSNVPCVNVPQAPGDPPGWGGDVDTNVQWCSVVRTRLGDTRLVIGGEVDCVRGTYTSKTDTFVELKTSLVIRGAQDEMRFEKKLLKFYMQSFLLGVPVSCLLHLFLLPPSEGYTAQEILVGFRTPSGEITTTQTFRTVELPRLVRGKAHGWDPKKCFAWGNELLEFLKKNVRSSSAVGIELQGPNARVWRLTFSPGVGVELRQLDDSAVRGVESAEGDREAVDRVGFLPRWYWDEVVKADDSSGTT